MKKSAVAGTYVAVQCISYDMAKSIIIIMIIITITVRSSSSGSGITAKQ